MTDDRISFTSSLVILLLLCRGSRSGGLLLTPEMSVFLSLNYSLAEKQMWLSDQIFCVMSLSSVFGPIIAFLIFSACGLGRFAKLSPGSRFCLGGLSSVGLQKFSLSLLVVGCSFLAGFKWRADGGCKFLQRCLYLCLSVLSCAWLSLFSLCWFDERNKIADFLVNYYSAWFRYFEWRLWLVLWPYNRLPQSSCLSSWGLCWSGSDCQAQSRYSGLVCWVWFE